MEGRVMPGSHNRAAGAGHARWLTNTGREQRDAGFATVFHANASRAWPICSARRIPVWRRRARLRWRWPPDRRRSCCGVSDIARANGRPTGGHIGRRAPRQVQKGGLQRRWLRSRSGNAAGLTLPASSWSAGRAILPPPGPLPNRRRVKEQSRIGRLSPATVLERPCAGNGTSPRIRAHTDLRSFRIVRLVSPSRALAEPL